MNDFYQSVRPKTQCRDNTKVKEQTGEDLFKKPTSKKWAPNKDHHTIETLIEATKYGVKDELKTMRACKYINLSKKEQQTLQEELKLREDIVIKNACKIGRVVILYVKDYIKDN